MPMLFSATIGAAIAAGYWFLWVRCPACRTINAIGSAPRRGRDQPDSVTVLPLVPAERAIRRAGAAIANEHRRRNARRAQAHVALFASLEPNVRHQHCAASGVLRGQNKRHQPFECLTEVLKL
jgi:hypothetical protein